MIRAFRSGVFWAVVLGSFGLTALSGCGYTLRGKVVEGTAPGVELVHEIDQRLQGPGIINAEVMVRRDPDSMHPHLAGRTRTSSGGGFSMSISEFGAGWMEEQWQVQAAMTGFQNTQAIMKLPAKGSKWRVLITLAPGQSTPLEQPN